MGILIVSLTMNHCFSRATYIDGNRLDLVNTIRQETVNLIEKYHHLPMCTRGVLRSGQTPIRHEQ